MFNQVSPQIREIEQHIRQLEQQTRQATAMYQQLLEQEQQNAAQLEQLAEKERKAAHTIQMALQGHQTAMQQYQHIIQLAGQIEQNTQSQSNHFGNPDFRTSAGIGLRPLGGQTFGQTGIGSGSMGSSGNFPTGSMNSGTPFMQNQPGIHGRGY